MTHDVVTVISKQAIDGLHLPSDLAVYAIYITGDNLLGAIRKLHASQTGDHTIKAYADVIENLFSEVEPGHRTESFDSIVREIMACSAIAYTHTSYQRAALAASTVIFNIHLRTIKAPSMNGYPLLIPHELNDVEVSSVAEVNPDLAFRVLTLDPWVSWMERQRAQHQRVVETLANNRWSLGEAEPMLDSFSEIVLARGSYKRKRYARRRNRQTKNSIKRGLTLYERLFRDDRLQQLLSGDGVPMVIEGKRYRYILMFDGDIVSSMRDALPMMSPVHTLIKNKDDETLCSGCVYFDLPLIDHVIAMRLQVLNEDTELDFLRKVNVQNPTLCFFNDAVLPELKGVRDPVSAAPTFIENLLHGCKAELDVARRTRREAGNAEIMPMVFHAMDEIMRPKKNFHRLMRDMSGPLVGDWVQFGQPQREKIERLRQEMLAGNF